MAYVVEEKGEDWSSKRRASLVGRCRVVALWPQPLWLCERQAACAPGRPLVATCGLLQRLSLAAGQDFHDVPVSMDAYPSAESGYWWQSHASSFLESCYVRYALCMTMCSDSPVSLCKTSRCRYVPRPCHVRVWVICPTRNANLPQRPVMCHVS